MNHGYQGNVFLYSRNGQRFVVKTATGWGLGRFVRWLMLRNEYKAYCCLADIEGIPQCYGLLDGKYLVLECVEGESLRNNTISEKTLFIERLFNVISNMHAAGVVHGDLKRKDNLLVVDGAYPWIVDFGVACVRKNRFAPFNHLVFEILRTFDFNAWVKLKYGRRLLSVSQEDALYYRRTLIERTSKTLKRLYKRIKSQR
ncbi:MAG: hypothetical protein GY868_02030 [Deltaproteobacteria bacterium]|nr:hypothetical protein [Deltaproteobacteria bacterium]